VKTEAVGHFKTTVRMHSSTYVQTPWCHISEDNNLRSIMNFNNFQ